MQLFCDFEGFPKKHCIVWVGNIWNTLGISPNFLFANHSFDFFFSGSSCQQHSDWTGLQVMYQIPPLTSITMEIQWRKMPHVEIRWILPLGLERPDPFPTERGVMVDVVIFNRKKGKLPERRYFFVFCLKVMFGKEHHFSMKDWRIQDWYIICKIYLSVACILCECIPERCHDASACSNVKEPTTLLMIWRQNAFLHHICGSYYTLGKSLLHYRLLATTPPLQCNFCSIPPLKCIQYGVPLVCREVQKSHFKITCRHTPILGENGFASIFKVVNLAVSMFCVSRLGDPLFLAPPKKTATMGEPSPDATFSSRQVTGEFVRETVCLTPGAIHAPRKVGF